ncbi:MAG: hypothetical protein OXC44_04260 [Proteobacteria bacterium]|nr:hypothetical protein [Pseudomonadota bacterium]
MAQSAAVTNNYRSFKTQWGQWAATMAAMDSDSVSEPFIGLLWGNSDFLLMRSWDRTKALWSQKASYRASYRASHRARLWDGSSVSSKDLAMMFRSANLFGQTEFHMIADMQDMSLAMWKEALKAHKDHSFKHHMVFSWRSKEARLPKAFWETLPDNRHVVGACALKSYEYVDFVRDLCGVYGVSVTPQGAALVIEHIGERPFYVEQMLKKWKLLGKQGNISQKELLEHMDALPEQIAFKIIHYILKGQKELAYLALRDVLVAENIPPVVILGALYYHLKQLIALLSAKAAHSHKPHKQQSVPVIPKVPYYVQKRYASYLKNMNEEKLLSALELAAKVDVYLKTKSTLMSPEILLTSLLTAL